MPILDTAGRPERLLAVARDITEVKRAEAELEGGQPVPRLLDRESARHEFLKDARSLRYVRRTVRL